MWDYKISGVYKITFDDGCFYIGCSNHLRNRASVWDSVFRTKKGTPGFDIGTNMINKIRECVNASLDIVELCSVADLKDKEALYLFESRDDSRMLSSWNGGAWKPVLQYKADTGLFIKKHVSISSAAKYMGSPVSRVQDVLQGIRQSHKGMVFVHESEYNNRRKEIVKKRYKRVSPKNGRDVIMFDMSGCEIMRFKKIIDAAMHVSVCTTSVSRAIDGKQQSAGGHIFKYA